MLTGLLEAAGGQGLAPLLAARRCWPAWVGAELAAQARPVSYDRGVLTVSVAHAVFSQELRLREVELKQAFEAETGRRLERLSFRAESSRAR